MAIILKDHLKSTSKKIKNDALELIADGIDAVRIDRLLSNFNPGEACRHASDVLVLAVGKAAIPMAQAVQKSLLANEIPPSKISLDLTVPLGYETELELGHLRHAGHPKPNDASKKAATEVLEKVSRLSATSFVYCLISGGGSALWSAPIAPLSLNDLSETVAFLLNAGLDIHEINSIRSRLTTTGAGKLAKAIDPARSEVLILSDVPSDDPRIIASGPCCKERPYTEMIEVLERHKLSARLPKIVIDALISSNVGEKAEEFVYPKNRILGSNSDACNAMIEKAEILGYTVKSAKLEGEARQKGKEIVEWARKRPSGKHAIILGGETFVTVKGKGEGGRNQELVLASSIAMDGLERAIFVAAAGTDGIDGFSDAAGAWAGNESLSQAQKLGLSAKNYLENNDSHNFFRALGAQIVTGPTHTNVMDIAVVLIDD